MLTRLPTLLAGKAFAVYERLPEEKKDGYKGGFPVLARSSSQLAASACMSTFIQSQC
jgi:hypothetical protein